MIFERSTGGVVFYRQGPQFYFLLLEYESMKEKGKPAYWEFPRGLIEEGEREQEAALREVQEETSLDNLRIIPGFRYTTERFYKREGKLVKKYQIMYLMEAGKKKGKPSKEHLDLDWLTIDEALEKLKFKDSQETLRKAYNFLQKGQFQEPLL